MALDKKQWNIRVEDQLIDRLNKLAAKSGYSSGNELAADLLDIYAETMTDLLRELREIEIESVKRQREKLLARLRQSQDSGPGPERRSKDRS